MALLLFMALVACTVWEGYVLHVMWAWYLTPILGWKAITVSQGVGVAAIAGLLTHQAPADAFDDSRSAKVVVWAILAPAIALLVGWIAK